MLRFVYDSFFAGLRLKTMPLACFSALPNDSRVLLLTAGGEGETSGQSADATPAGGGLDGQGLGALHPLSIPEGHWGLPQ